jgi:hypothetical protein
MEFAYNRAVHSTTQLCPFEVVYDFKPITPLDLLPSYPRASQYGSIKEGRFCEEDFVKTKEAIEKKGNYTAYRANKKRKEVLFQPGDMDWVHFHKDRFP